MAYKLYFRGELSPGVTQEQAAERIARLFRQPAGTMRERLFSGGTVRVKTVETKEEAKRYVAAFAKAGMKLEVRRAASESGGTAEPETPPATRREPGTRRPRGILAIASLVIVAIVAALAGAWYTTPIWRNGTVSEEQASASRALATGDLVALGHLDVRRATDLQARLFGLPDPDALLAGEDSLWDSLVAAGIDPRERIDDAIVALHSDGDGDSSSWAVALAGRLDVEAVRRWIDSRYIVDRYDAASGTIYFSWLDDKTCTAVSLKAARIGPSYVVIADADKIDALWARSESSEPAAIAIDAWLGMTERQVLTIGIFNPASMGHAADGMAGMMLAAAGQAAEPAEALYFGVAPALMPPGIVMSGAITSDDQPFLDQTHKAGSTWLESARTKAVANKPDLVDIFDRIFVSLDDRTLSAGVRLDTDFDDELQRVFSALFQQSFNIGPAQAATGSMPTEDQVDEDPAQFFNASADSLQPYASFGSGFFEPQWQSGPFGLAVSKLELNDDGNLKIALRGKGRGLLNLGGRSKLVRMRVTEVTDEGGQSLLPERECGPSQSRDWEDAGQVSEGSQFKDGELVRFPTVSLDKELSLREGVAAGTVASIRGEIDYQLPVEVRSVTVDAPLDDKVVEGDDVRILFQAGSDRSVSYQASGETHRLLAIRALNAQGQVLENGGSMRGKNWFGSGEHASIDINGKVAAVEVVLAEEFEPLAYPFELKGAYPPIGTGNANNHPPATVATPDTLARALKLDAPEVAFPFSEPMATVVAGPGLLAVERVQASSFMGLVAQVELYVPNDMPLTGQLNGASIIVDRAELADGSDVALDLMSPVGLSHDGAYWMNGEYTTDPEKPWIKGRATLQASEYEGDTPEAVHGRIIFRAVKETLTKTMPVAPGTRTSAEGVELVVAEWRENGMSLELPSGADRVVSIEALDGEGKLAGRAENIDGSGAESTARIDLDSRPQSLRVLLSTESVEHEIPFSVRITP